MSVVIFFSFLSVVLLIGLVLSYLTIRHHWFSQKPQAKPPTAEKTN